MALDLAVKQALKRRKNSNSIYLHGKTFKTVQDNCKRSWHCWLDWSSRPTWFRLSCLPTLSRYSSRCSLIQKRTTILIYLAPALALSCASQAKRTTNLQQHTPIIRLYKIKTPLRGFWSSLIYRFAMLQFQYAKFEKKIPQIAPNDRFLIKI